MLLFKKKYFSYLYIFFLALVFFFSEFSTNIAYGKNFIVSGIKTKENYDLNFDKSKVIDKGFDKAFTTLIYKTVEKKDRFKFENTSLKKIKSHNRQQKIFGKLEIVRKFTFIFKNSKTYGCIQIVSFLVNYYYFL